MARGNKTKIVTAEEFIGRFSATERAAIEARAKELIAEEMTLGDLRKALTLTQEQLGAVLGIGQEHVSRLEHRSDMLLSTLARYVKAMGGELKLTVSFPNRKAVALANLSDVIETRPALQRKRRSQQNLISRRTARG